MSILKYSLITAVTSLIIVIPSCGGIDNNAPELDTRPNNSSAGVYRIELSISGDIEGFAPLIAMYPTYSPDTFNLKGVLGTVFDENGQVFDITNSFAYGFNYDEDPENFRSHIVRYTTKEALGYYVFIHPQKTALQSPTTEEYDTVSKIRIDYKGYKDDKLIKQEIVEADNKIRLDYKKDGLGMYEFLIGQKLSDSLRTSTD